MLHEMGEVVISNGGAIVKDRVNKLAAQPAKRLPRAQSWELIEACQQLTNSQAREALRTRLLPFVLMPGEILYVAAGPIGFSTARKRQVKVVAMADPKAMLQALQAVFGKQILHNSCFHLANDTPEYSASKRLTARQGIFLLIGLCAILSSLWFAPFQTMIAGSAFFSVMFLAVVGLRLASFMPPAARSGPPRVALSDAQLPVYTVLVPLFRETRVINQLLHGLIALNYPALCRNSTNIPIAHQPVIIDYKACPNHRLSTP